MVKKLISGILKKNSPPTEEKKEDVPDELPALGEDTAEETKTEEEPPKEEAAAPDELPSLDTPEQTPQADHTEEPAPVAVEKMPELDASKTTEATGKSEVKEAPVQHGFFEHVSEIVNEGKSPDGLIAQDLVANMKENWGIHKQSAKSGLSPIEERTITKQVEDVLTQLRLMESKWRAHRMVVDEEQKNLKEQEAKMRDKEKELKTLLRKARLYQHSAQPILLKNSIPVRNVSELVNALSTIDKRSFAKLVQRDHKLAAFADSIDKHLANQLQKTRSKKKVQDILDHYVKRMS